MEADAERKRCGAIKKQNAKLSQYLIKNKLAKSNLQNVKYSVLPDIASKNVNAQYVRLVLMKLRFTCIVLYISISFDICICYRKLFISKSLNHNFSDIHTSNYCLKVLSYT